MNDPIRVLVLFGPTASGKTEILFNLFGRSKSGLQAEVISADSMQVYRGMDIGTAKPSMDERALVPHHLIDICSPDEQFNCGNFVHLADKACLDIANRQKLPVISGGAGFYLKNFILGLPEAPPSDEKIRSQLKQELNLKGAPALMEELAACDPESASRIHINDEYRLLRALEVFRLCGRPLSAFAASVGTAAPAKNRPVYNFVIIGLFRCREELYRRINLRTEAMFAQGLPGEVNGLFEKGYTPQDPGLRAIGYREFFVEEPGEPKKWRLSRDFSGVQALIAQNSRRYAKRQITFFASIPGVKWIEACQGKEQTTQLILRELESFDCLRGVHTSGAKKGYVP